jgi:ADP-ribose pyrophosphatase
VREWRRLGEDRVLHDGHLRVVGRTFEMPDGEQAEWELLGPIESVGVLALTDEGSVVAVREYRPGPGRIVLNLPSGMVDDGERPEEAAARELTEETGWVAGTVDVVASFSAMAHGLWTKHAVVARGCRPTGSQSLDEHEHIEPVVLTVDEVRAAVRSGEMIGTDMVYLALDHAGLL